MTTDPAPSSPAAGESVLFGEKLITLDRAREQWPGEPPSMTSLWKYVSTGLQGKVLESLLVNGRRRTSEPAIRRFIEKTSKPR